NARWEEMKRLDKRQRSECPTDESGAIVLGRKFEDEFDPHLIEELTDLREVADWDQIQSECCPAYVCNSSIWQQITGTTSPQPRLASRAAQPLPKNLFIMRDPFFM